MQHRFDIQHTWQGATLPTSEYAWIELSLERDQLALCWDAPYWVEPAPNVPAGECDFLWQYQAVEVFLGTRAEPNYLEFEFGPAGHWLAFEFSAYRSLAARRGVHSYTWQVHGPRWTGNALIVGLPLLSRVSCGNAHLVHRCPHGRSHCSSHGDPTTEPDFHRSDLFLPLDGGSSGRV